MNTPESPETLSLLRKGANIGMKVGLGIFLVGALPLVYSVIKNDFNVEGVNPADAIHKQTNSVRTNVNRVLGFP